MNTSTSSAPPMSMVQAPAWFWCLWPAAIMSLGWGLRGYIGGGFLGAMIPGALVAISLCLLLGYRREAAAFAAAFGALGVGFGGGMTYGQTIGLIRNLDTAAWGLLGLTLKGAIWGLLGGAVLAMGLLAHRLRTGQLIAAVLWLLIGCVLGIGLINEPKLIYFSGPTEPRPEYWAGFLFGALALLVYLQRWAKDVGPVAWRFALYGFVAGGIGFGGGGLWMLLGLHTETMKWLPWWKFMEFTFGFFFGAGLGLCALHLRQQLPPPADTVPAPRDCCRWWFVLPALVVVFALMFWPMLARPIGGYLRELDLDAFTMPVSRTFLGFTGLGCLLLVVARQRESFAWQIAGTMTFIATLIDLQRDWGGEAGLEIFAPLRWAIVLEHWIIAFIIVAQWDRRPWHLQRIFLALLWAVMAVGYLKGLSTGDLWSPDADAISTAGSAGAYLLQQLRSELVVHAIFAATLIASAMGARRFRVDPHPAPLA